MQSKVGEVRKSPPNKFPLLYTQTNFSGFTSFPCHFPFFSCFTFLLFPPLPFFSFHRSKMSPKLSRVDDLPTSPTPSYATGATQYHVQFELWCDPVASPTVILDPSYVITLLANYRSYNCEATMCLKCHGDEHTIYKHEHHTQTSGEQSISHGAYPKHNLDKN